MAWSLYIALTLTAGTIFLWSRNSRHHYPFPPGPPAEPILGHLRVLPQSDQEQVFREWSKTYGDVLYFHVPGRSYLVINSLNAAIELLDKRSGIYSDRMRLVLYDMMGWYPNLTFLRYGKRFQKHRKLLQEYLHQKKCLEYYPLQTKQAQRLLAHLLKDPSDFVNHFHRFATIFIVKITYGIDIIDDTDPYFEMSNKGLASLTTCGPAGSTPVDFLPFLRFMPSWFPGTFYATKAKILRSAVRKMHEYPFNLVKQQFKDGTAKSSYLTYNLDLLHGNYSDKEHMDDLEGSAGALFTGGAETTHSALWFFILAMTLFPECQKIAQEEIDRVIGKGRLPELTDRRSLPYADAVMQEVLRWNTVIPSGVPHCSIEDDIYNGMFIPKGTVVIANAYAILRDETVYSDPDSFNPSRYLPVPEGNAEPYPIGHFGFGRRICPGQHLVDASLWIAVCSLLATFEIHRAKDESGNEIIPEVELVTGVTSHPKPFPCVIKPRNENAESLIRQAQLFDDI